MSDPHYSSISWTSLLIALWAHPSSQDGAYRSTQPSLGCCNAVTPISPQIAAFDATSDWICSPRGHCSIHSLPNHMGHGILCSHVQGDFHCCDSRPSSLLAHELLSLIITFTMISLNTFSSPLRMERRRNIAANDQFSRSLYGTLRWGLVYDLTG